MKRITTVLLVLSVAIVAPCLLADESPDARVNPQTGGIEISDPVWTDNNYNIRYVVAPGKQAQVSDVTTNPADDRGPRMAIAPNGDAYVVWWRDVATPQVLIRRHDHAEGSWSAESVLSDTDQPGQAPQIVHDGADAWVAFSELSGQTQIIRAGAIEDTPDPFGVFCEIGSTEFGGALDLQIHAASGHLWATWTDSDLDVAWSEYDYTSATWGSVDYDSYAQDSLKHAQERIRSSILGN